MDPGKLASFISITGSTEDEAKAYLESSGWDLALATASYFEEDHPSTAPLPAPLPAPIPAQLAGPSTLAGTSTLAGPSNLAGPSTSEGSSGPGGARVERGKAGKVKTLAEILASASNESGSESEGEDYFAGGEKSGIMMKGAPKDRKPLDLVDDILKQAAKAGPRPDDVAVPKKSFGGHGYRLGQESGPSTPTVVPKPEEQDQSQTVERMLTFWKDGFSIDDGELKRYDDPENQAFLTAIKSGRAPTQFLNVQFGQKVEVKVAHRIKEDYVPPAKKPMAAFSGSGQRLGGLVTPAPSLPGSMPGGWNAPQPTVSVAPVTPSMKLDENAPITTIQIRLADGTRLVSKFNQSHTVDDVRSFVNQTRAGESQRNYVLQTNFPVKVLTDGKLSLKDAGLLNAVVVQRYV